MHPKYLLDELSAYEIAEWEAYDRLDPIGEFRADFRMAELATVITNIAIKWAAGKKKVDLVDILDFIPKWDAGAPKEVKKQSVEEMKKALKEIANHAKKQPKADLQRPPQKLRKDKGDVTK